MTVLWLGSDPIPDQWHSAPQSLVRALSPDDAHRALEQHLPDVIVVGEAEWAQEWVRVFPRDTRPAIVALGFGARTIAALADDWMLPTQSSSELAERLRIASLRARHRRRLARRAMIDPLTSLPNRRAAICGILRGAARAKRDGSALSLVLIDLDDFKSVNEQGGHEAGDRVLRNVGAILGRIVRTGELSARIGGDEFAVVVVGRLAQAEATAQRVRAALRDSGISASVAAGELEPREQLRALYRRVDFLLKAKKDARRPMRNSGASRVLRAGQPSANPNDTGTMQGGASAASLER
jgi:diguanylate cyclase (GGDEF)-like protein